MSELSNLTIEMDSIYVTLFLWIGDGNHTVVPNITLDKFYPLYMMELLFATSESTTIPLSFTTLAYT